MRPKTQAILITLVFIGMYPLLRSLPDAQCGFLHYDYVGETDGGTEFCGLDESAVFLDLQRVRFPIRAYLEATAPPQVAKSAAFTLDLTMPDGRPVLVEELAVVHTEKLHLFIISPDLEDYHHLHPEPVNMPGRYGFSFTPRRSGRYTLFAEFVPLRSASVVITQMDVDVIEPATAVIDTALPEAVSERYRIHLDLLDSESWVCKTNQEFTLRIVDTEGMGPVPLQEVMGAYAHLVAFDTQRRGLAHMHPMDEGEGLDGAAPQFRFSLRTDLPGDYVIWAQIKLSEQERFIPFTMTAFES